MGPKERQPERRERNSNGTVWGVACALTDCDSLVSRGRSWCRAPAGHKHTGKTSPRGRAFAQVPGSAGEWGSQSGVHGADSATVGAFWPNHLFRGKIQVWGEKVCETEIRRSSGREREKSATGAIRAHVLAGQAAAVGAQEGQWAAEG